MANILLIDDDKMIGATMTNVIKDMGYHIVHERTLESGCRRVDSEAFDLVFLDVRLPDGNGLDHLEAIQAAGSRPEVIIITGYAEPDGAKIAIQQNAWDYIKKPASIDTIALVIKRALDYRRKKEAIRDHAPVPIKRDRIIGNSPAIVACLDTICRAAEGMSNILITGETGTGKELFARAIHENSPRRNNHFVVVDCGALSESLAESRLFGHKKGAFTGAQSSETGLIEHADGGTLFLDEVGELPPAVQKAFLRVLQERRFLPIGRKDEVESDFRLVAATNQNLEARVNAGDFREDLLFRLRSIVLELPPLRHRGEDLKDLTIHFATQICEERGIGLKGFSPDFFNTLGAYDWPGNVRELYHSLEFAITEALYEPMLYPQHLPPQLRAEVASASLKNIDTDNGRDLFLRSHPQSDLQFGDFPPWKAYRKSVLAQTERHYLKSLKYRAGGDIKEAVRLSGLSEPRLYELFRKYDIPPSD